MPNTIHTIVVNHGKIEEFSGNLNQLQLIFDHQFKNASQIDPSIVKHPRSISTFITNLRKVYKSIYPFSSTKINLKPINPQPRISHNRKPVDPSTISEICKQCLYFKPNCVTCILFIKQMVKSKCCGFILNRKISHES